MIFWKMWVTKQYRFPIDYFPHVMEVSGDHQVVGYPHFPKLYKRKNHTDFEQLEGE